LFWDPAGFESGMTISWKGIGVQCYKRIFGVVLLERVVEGEEAGEVFRVGDEGCPD
jgi:hypothetical protein